MAFDRLKKLPCFPEILEKIKAGVSIESIGEWIQDDMHEYTDVKLESLNRMLYRFKEEIPVNQLDVPQPMYLHKKIEKLRRGTNEVEELEKLYLAQLSRISAAMETEDKIKFINSKLWKDVELAKNLLIEMAKLKMELGIYSRSAIPVHMTGSIEHTHKEFLENMDPERRRKLGEVAGSLMDGIKAMLGTGTPPETPVAVEADFEVIETPTL